MRTSYYGPSDPDVPTKSKGENERDWRFRVRSEMQMKVSVWARSPSPPSKKSKEVTKVAAKSVDMSKRESKDDFGRDVAISKSEVKEKKQPQQKKEESSSDSSSSSSDSSSSDSGSSDSSVDRRKKRSSSKKKKSSSKKSKSKSKSSKKGKSKSRKHSKRRRDSSSSESSDDSSSDSSDSEQPTKKTKSASRTESKPVSDTPVGGKFDEYDQDEASRFRLEVQGIKGGRKSDPSVPGGYHSESEDDQDFGPMPMVQPKEYGEDKRVRIVCAASCTLLSHFLTCIGLSFIIPVELWRCIAAWRRRRHRDVRTTEHAHPTPWRDRLERHGDRGPREPRLRHEWLSSRAHERCASTQGEPGVLCRGEARPGSDHL